MSKRQPSYVYERAELLGALFLDDLNPAFVVRAPSNSPLDFIVAFTSPDHGLKIIGVEVKGTQTPVKHVFSFIARDTWISSIRSANVPVLLLVIDAKMNEIYFGWGEKLERRADRRSLRGSVHATIPVKAAAEYKDELLAKVFE
jgi:hypothetical protein